MTCGEPQFAPFLQSAAHPSGPSEPIITVSSRCFCVHCSASASGIRFFAFACLQVEMNSFQVFGAPVIPAFFSVAGLYHRTFARWMFTGTEYRWPL